MEDCINSASTYDTNTILYYSYCFHTRIQYPEETFIDFLNDIIELANLCDFEAKNRMIRDQIVVGIRDSNVRKELFKLGNPKLDELLEYLNGVENSQKIVTEASNNEDESYSYDDVDKDEQSKNIKLEIFDMEFNEDCTEDDQDFHASSESLQEKNLDIETDKSESQENLGDSQLNEEKISSTSYTLHSYIIKKEIDDNVDDKSDSDESSAENWDVSHIDKAFGISGDKDSLSDNSTTSNQCVPDGYQKEDESSEIHNKAINIAEQEKKEARTEKESNVFTIENKPVNSELEAGSSIKSKFPKRKIHKVIDVIEIDDSDDEVDFKRNFNSNMAEKLVKVIDPPSEILPIVKVERKCVNDNAPSLINPNNNVPNTNSLNDIVPNAKSELDIESKNTKVLCDETKVTAKGNITRKNTYRYFCSECNKNFSSKYILKNHVLRHLGEAPYKCSYCLKAFSYSQNLNTHLLIHTDQKPYKCQECDKCFRQKANLDAHAIRHADKKLLECKEEIETVEGKETFKKIRKKRGRKKREQSLTCKKCNKTLSSVQALRLHKFTHLGIKPYECDYCDKKYAQSHTLRTHLLVHTGETPYSCNECTKSFRSKGILKAHMLIHKNDKLFSCNVCMKSFKRESSYKAHIHTTCSYKRKIIKQQKM